MHGVVLGLHVNPNGGVPKHPVETLDVRPDGHVGDRQNDRVITVDQHVPCASWKSA